MSASSRFVALLRAINVGGHVVKMDALRKHFTRLGFGNVETFIASGNVLFDAPGAKPRDLEDRIAMELERVLGYPVATFVRSPGELASVVHSPAVCCRTRKLGCCAARARDRTSVFRASLEISSNFTPMKLSRRLLGELRREW